LLDGLYAYRLMAMDDARILVATARRAAGLSLRELGRLAGVSFTTISRIEGGESDPTVGMLRRVLAAAGQHLKMSTEPASDTQPSIANLADAVTVSPAGERPEWTTLRAFVDYLTRYPAETPGAITSQPHTESRLMRALLAGMAEKLADDHGLARPGWTWTAPKMKPEWEMPGTPLMRAERRAHAPKQLLDRGLVIDESSLWRDRETVGV
jgi:transcriptional regulator with XRE-family HTH domain